jgi:hypothetical protein
MNSNYKPYISAARTKARQDGKDSSDEYGYCIGEPIQAMMGYWNDDAGYCIYLRNERKGISNNDAPQDQQS